MDKRTEAAFEKIRETTSEAVNAVKCSKKDAIEGIETILSDLESIKECLEQEVEAEENEG